MKKTLILLAAAAIAGWTFWPRPVLSHERVATTVSYDKEIVRIMNKRCVACHSENNLSIAFTTYENTRPWARAIEEEVLRRNMPPWRAVQGYGKFVNENGLTNRELQFLIAWIEGNGPKTKGQALIVNLDQGETAGADVLKTDFTKWQLGKPDLEAQLSGLPIQPGQGNAVRRASIDLKLTSERRVRAIEFKPADRRAIRAVFFSVEETGQYLGSWTPWYGITALPKDVAYVLPPGAKVTAEIHYRGSDEQVDDKGTLGLYFLPGAAVASPADVVVEAKPEGAQSAGRQRLAGVVKLPADTNLLSFRPDLQPGVQSIEVSARKPDGTVQVLLLVRDILQAWPTPYILEEPVPLPKDTQLEVVAYQSIPQGAPAPAPAPLKLTVSVYNGPRPVLTTQ
jgi:hypothetical protein